MIMVDSITYKLIEDVKDTHGYLWGMALFEIYLKSKTYPYNIMSSFEWFTNATPLEFNKLVNDGYELE